MLPPDGTFLDAQALERDAMRGHNPTQVVVVLPEPGAAGAAPGAAPGVAVAPDVDEVDLEEDNERRVNEVVDRGPQPGAAPEEDGPARDGEEPPLDFRFEALGQGDNETDGVAADALRALCRAQVEHANGVGPAAPPVDERAVDTAVTPRAQCTNPPNPELSALSHPTSRTSLSVSLSISLCLSLLRTRARSLSLFTLSTLSLPSLSRAAPTLARSRSLHLSFCLARGARWSLHPSPCTL